MGTDALLGRHRCVEIRKSVKLRIVMYLIWVVKVFRIESGIQDQFYVIWREIGL